VSSVVWFKIFYLFLKTVDFFTYFLQNL